MTRGLRAPADCQLSNPNARAIETKCKVPTAITANSDEIYT